MRAEDLVRMANAAVCEAKLRGSACVYIADGDMASPSASALELELQLRNAIASGGSALKYQPVVASDGTIVSAEALVRWQHPERGLLAPDKFLPVAKQGGMLGDLDRWVLRTALREATNWRTADPQSASRSIWAS